MENLIRVIIVLLYLLFEWLTIQHLENVIKSKIPGIQSLISKTVSELETELSRLGKPIAADAGVSFYLFYFSFGSWLIIFKILNIAGDFPDQT